MSVQICQLCHCCVIFENLDYIPCNGGPVLGSSEGIVFGSTGIVLGTKDVTL